MEFHYTSIGNTYMFNKVMCDLPFHTKDFSIIWHNDSLLGSDQQNIRHCDIKKQPGETVIAVSAIVL